MTNLPATVRFDSVPGRSWTHTPLGRLVRAIPGPSQSHYREGYYRLAGRDSVDVDWTNSVVGLNLKLKFEQDSMRGVASAWTDYSGEEHATVVLRRSTCTV